MSQIQANPQRQQQLQQPQQQQGLGGVLQPVSDTVGGPVGGLTGNQGQGGQQQQGGGQGQQQPGQGQQGLLQPVTQPVQGLLGGLLGGGQGQQGQGQQPEGLLGGLLGGGQGQQGQGLGGVLQPVSDTVGKASQGLGNVLGNIGGSTTRHYDPDEIGYYRQQMERQGPPEQQHQYMSMIIEILQKLVQQQIQQEYTIRQIIYLLQNK
jgi:eukaryotic translation initiation factor 2C